MTNNCYSYIGTVSLYIFVAYHLKNIHSQLHQSNEKQSVVFGRVTQVFFFSFYSYSYLSFVSISVAKRYFLYVTLLNVG